MADTNPVAFDRGTTDAPRAGAMTGILLIVCAVFLFACMDTTTKHLTATYNVPLVIAVRYVGNLLVVLAIFAPRHGRQLFVTRRTGLVMVRAGCLAAASLFAGLALQRMPVAETMSIVFLAPLGVVLLARPILGERIGIVGWLAAVAGFLGVLLIVRPGSGLDAWGVLFAVLCAVVTVAYYLLSRILARSESTMAMLFYTTLAGALVFSAMLPWSWGGPAPSTLDTVLFAAMGLLAGIGHWLFTAAHRFAPASTLAPVNYLQLVWGGILGWLVFAHVPDALTLAGMAVITAAGVTNALRARFAGR
jgi:drug/metabolite transporter (DMT)-like permease